MARRPQCVVHGTRNSKVKGQGRRAAHVGVQQHARLLVRCPRRREKAGVSRNFRGRTRACRRRTRWWACAVAGGAAVGEGVGAMTAKSRQDLVEAGRKKVGPARRGVAYARLSLCGRVARVCTPRAHCAYICVYVQLEEFRRRKAHANRALLPDARGI